MSEKLLFNYYKEMFYSFLMTGFFKSVEHFIDARNVIGMAVIILVCGLLKIDRHMKMQ